MFTAGFDGINAGGQIATDALHISSFQVQALHQPARYIKHPDGKDFFWRCAGKLQLSIALRRVWINEKGAIDARQTRHREYRLENKPRLTERTLRTGYGNAAAGTIADYGDDGAVTPPMAAPDPSPGYVYQQTIRRG